MGMMGGTMAHEFMAPSPAGEDDVALCDGCGYAANVELALSVPKTPSFTGLGVRRGGHAGAADHR